MELPAGRVISALTENPGGHFENPFTDEDLMRTFDRLADRYLTDDGVKRVGDMLWDVENLRSARDLTDAMRAGARAVQ